MNPGDLSWEPIFALGETKIYEHTPLDKIIKRAKYADVLVINKIKLDADTLLRLNNLKFICVSATGYDNIDLDAASQLGIVISNVHSYSANSVAQHVYALVFGLSNKVRKYNQDIIQGRWKTEGTFSFWDESIYEISGKIFGIVGFGAIGKEVATIAKAFGMEIYVYTNNPEPKDWPDVEFVSLETIFEYSHIISLHVPYNSSNHHMINKDLLKLMNSNALLINTSRGAIINDDDLYESLINENIGGAGLDVLVEEPPYQGNKLIGLPNCIITPHQAWASVESRKRLLDGVVFNINSFIEGNPTNIISKKRKLNIA